MKITQIPFNKNYGVDKQGNFYSHLYQVSEKGKKGIQTKEANEWYKLKVVINPRSGYKQVKINKKIYRLHRLIAFTFLPNPHKYTEVRHLNDIKIDNRLENLAWGNSKLNAQDRVLNDKQVQGTKVHCAKLNPEKVKIIRRYKGIKSSRELGRMFGVSKEVILGIFNNKIWKSVKGGERYV